MARPLSKVHISIGSTKMSKVHFRNGAESALRSKLCTCQQVHLPALFTFLDWRQKCTLAKSAQVSKVHSKKVQKVHFATLCRASAVKVYFWSCDVAWLYVCYIYIYIYAI